MTNTLTSADFVKIFFGVLLLTIWVGLIAMKLDSSPGTTDLIAFCKLGLTGLSAHYLTNYTPTPPAGTTVITATPPQGTSL